ncbi:MULTISPECIES: hypothetical protein [unclassified Psychrobacter]|uniref:hypothetical protein n=1 Tax=unclassified Psychrobacter TaxID=196806 RepID=UPI0007146D70|nr:hypothetical protein [Psychrobacter sp. P11F6]KRG32538.1 hypothetical protein AK822_13490 [Psychrobacter sp. P11F6]
MNMIHANNESINVKPPQLSTDFRTRDVIMNAERLGAMHQTRVSFVRTLLRKIDREQWTLSTHLWDLDEQGYGTVIYRLNTPEHLYHLVVFCNELADEERNDRVIAQKWDVTFGLVFGEISEELLDNLQANVPLQEAGRNSNMVMVLARANKSVRVFDHIVSSLAIGQQPDLDILAQVGYILRTTAVYGNGKFGIYDFKPLDHSEDFNQSFRAQMCAVYLLREFSLDWVDYLAKQKGGSNAAVLHPEIKRYLGVGNATGLGMAPYLINHPCVVDQWLTTREEALHVTLICQIEPKKTAYFASLIERAIQHFSEIVTINEQQIKLNEAVVAELAVLQNTLMATINHYSTWAEFLQAHHHLSLESQEVIISCLMELYPERVDAFQEKINADETLSLPKGKVIQDLIDVLERHYQWAINIDFSQPDNSHWFWYRSVDKEEPRMGVRGQEPGADRELALDIARQANKLYLALKPTDPQQLISEFILNQPKYRSIARRVWTMGHKPLGDIQMNVLHKTALPMHLLRCKLSMFGATKFDPRSDRWVRITLFQGAPLFAEVHSDEWLFPLLPDLSKEQGGLTHDRIA